MKTLIKILLILTPVISYGQDSIQIEIADTSNFRCGVRVSPDLEYTIEGDTMCVIDMLWNNLIESNFKNDSLTQEVERLTLVIARIEGYIIDRSKPEK